MSRRVLICILSIMCCSQTMAQHERELPLLDLAATYRVVVNSNEQRFLLATSSAVDEWNDVLTEFRQKNTFSISADTNSIYRITIEIAETINPYMAAHTARLATNENTLVEARIVVSPKFFEFTHNNHSLLTNVIMHEIGHVLGLEHPSQADMIEYDSIMYTPRNNIERRRISPWDLMRLKSLYDFQK